MREKCRKLKNKKKELWLNFDHYANYNSSIFFEIQRLMS